MCTRHRLSILSWTFLSIVVLSMPAFGQGMPGGEQIIFNNGNIYAVENGPSKPTVFRIDTPYTITFLQNYHYFNNGALPGSIALIGVDGRRYGPWLATGQPGQGGVSDAYWNCYPNILLPAGTYTIEDSDPSTWSQNASSDNRGFSLVKGTPSR